MTDWLIKQDEDSFFGKPPGERTLDELKERGIIILDKPRGPNCKLVDTWVKQILNIKKCSHGGTLDPSVSGVLIIALNKATKLMPILLSSEKEYVGVLHLHKDIPDSKIRKNVKNFIGKQTQLPPKKSAVARRERVREVFDLEILDIDKRNVLFRIHTQAGFYVRRFAEQFGKSLETGAHLQELRRIRSGIFRESDSVNLQTIIDNLDDENEMRKIILPMESALRLVKKVMISDGAVDSIGHGSPLYVPGILRIEEGIEKEDWVAMITGFGELIGIGIAKMDSQEMLKNSKGVAVKTDIVVI
jgi:H/ACA ribonucleoprotein complex subunit 4